MFKPHPKPEKQQKSIESKPRRLGFRKCKNCGVRFRKLQPLQMTCSVACAIEYSRHLEEKKKQKQWQARKKKGLNALKSYPQKVNEVRSVFQEFIRLRDKNLKCISCDTMPNDKSNFWDGGHYLKAELYPGLIFNETNCNKQCKRCNNYDQGNLVDYRIGLIAKVGESEVLRLEEIKDSKRTGKYSDADLDLIKRWYRRKIKNLKNGI